MPDKTENASGKPAGPAFACPLSSRRDGDELAGEQLFVRADERMRIADHLHQTACQLLAVLQLNLGRMRRQGVDELETTISECEEIIAQVGCHLRGIYTPSPS